MIVVFLILSFVGEMYPGEVQDLKPAGRSESLAEVPVRDNALKVLTEKCNVCHRRQNPRKVFTESNMDGLAPAIYKQVFVKKRMPRGKGEY